MSMPLDQANLAENVRRLAGMHLASLETLAEYIGVSRQAMHAMVAYDLSSRSMPRTDTAIKLAEAFAVSLNALYQEPVDCLQEAVGSFNDAPIKQHVKERAHQRLHDYSLTKAQRTSEAQ
jgi:DNA-binding XRE family transcriptional regulator